MKQKNGFKVLKELQQHDTTSSIPLVFISAHAEVSKMTKGTRMGAKGYLV
jgi:DNA-binding response OmpR family regulator